MRDIDLEAPSIGVYCAQEIPTDPVWAHPLRIFLDTCIFKLDLATR